MRKLINILLLYMTEKKVTFDEQSNITLEIKKDEDAQATSMTKLAVEKANNIAKIRRDLNQIKAQLHFLNQLVNVVETNLINII